MIFNTMLSTAVQMSDQKRILSSPALATSARRIHCKICVFCHAPVNVLWPLATLNVFFAAHCSGLESAVKAFGVPRSFKSCFLDLAMRVELQQQSGAWKPCSLQNFVYMLPSTRVSASKHPAPARAPPG